MRDNLPKLAEVALRRLVQAIHPDSAAVLYLPSDASDPAQLELIARCGESGSYVRPLSSLAEVILREGNAVLARNVSQWDSTFRVCDPEGRSLASSVICAPIPQHDRVAGLVHL